MRVRPSLLLVATALAAFFVAQTAVGSTGSTDFQPAAAVAQAPPPAPKPLQPPKPKGHLIAALPGATSFSAHAGGAAAGTLGATSEFGSKQVLSVAARRGRWLGVVASALPNGQLAWVKRSDVRLKRTRWSLHADLSSHTLTLLRGHRVMRRISVAIGRAGSETPTGRFAITDKLAGSTYGPYYGCCILALSGHQTNTPAGWQGGDRLAIHGTSNPGSIGVPSSAGCLHADADDLRYLMRRVPLGTPVFIHA
jgi:lipoprotein-anchoring transpeptidase ErfK/SrfK